MNKNYKFKKFLIIGVLFFICFSGLVIYTPLISYPLANYLYERAIKEKIDNKTEFEQHLVLYSSKSLSIADSNWGKDYQLGQDEYAIQYMILWKEPIDVVYNKTGHIVQIFSSFE